MYRIGIDLGGTNIVAGIVDKDFNIVAKLSVPTNANRSSKEITMDIASLCKNVCLKNGIDFENIDAIGIASPGAVNNKTGVVEYSCNLPFRSYPIVSELKKFTGKENIFVDNDANAAAWGEAIAGSAKGSSHSIMITLGTGVGGGIVIDGRVESGFNGAGGELGHVVIEKGGRQCSCGRRGCWEAYSSATALIRMTSEKIDECKNSGRKTTLTDYLDSSGRVCGKTPFDAAKAGDEAAKEVIETYYDYLACGLVNIINIFQPEIISIGGGISNQGDNLINALLPRVRKEQYGGGLGFPLTELRVASLKNDAGVIGAAVLGMKI